ncbi:hypothetical protein EA656_00665 [Pseudoxanthomonas winnipegensis]|uniref:Uncharacterized protein n=1 Tax=Pseudoxanthomonas winnipegensis TaxID=2480810 RepID=A0A4Q8LYZ3_9GAMM|nr:hypothetical protein [Pseudoxanthomonas winnipegensis]TAA37225.1 hypothetical protein EA656_00665 [Pseudoxanthomonas winnipegensis]
MAMSAAAKKIRAKRASRPIYMTCMRLMDPATGELHGCFVPSHPIDQRLAKERGYKVGHEYRAELKQSRNRAFHRLARSGTWLSTTSRASRASTHTTRSNACRQSPASAVTRWRSTWGRWAR